MPLTIITANTMKQALPKNRATLRFYSFDLYPTEEDIRKKIIGENDEIDRAFAEQWDSMKDVYAGWPEERLEYVREIIRESITKRLNKFYTIVNDPNQLTVFIPYTGKSWASSNITNDEKSVKTFYDTHRDLMKHINIYDIFNTSVNWSGSEVISIDTSKDSI